MRLRKLDDDLIYGSENLLLLEPQNINKDDIKKISKAVFTAYKKGIIPEHIFEQLIEFLLGYFIETTIQDKLFDKTYKLENKLLSSFFNS
jgi:DNA polymerase III gamma/tau subunit